MAEATKLPIKTEKTSQPAPHVWRPFENLRQEIDRLFEDFGITAWRPPSYRSALDLAPFWTRQSSLAASPAVDIAETDGGFEITVELPGMEEKNIEVKYADSVLTIKGEKEEKSEEQKKDYYLSERTYGSFKRSFRVPDGVDADKIEATFKKGVLKVTLPKSVAAQQASKKIEIKAA